MKSITQFDAVSKQFTTHRTDVLKLEMKMNASASANDFWQVHDVYTTPSDTTVPLRSWPVGETYKEFKEGELFVSQGLFVCVSTTEATLTMGTGNEKFSAVCAELLDPELPADLSVAGDYTTNRQSLTVTTSPCKLVQLEVDGSAALAAAYVQIFCGANANGDIPKYEFPIAAGETWLGSTAKKFGTTGSLMLERNVSAGIVSLRTGCRVAISTTQGVRTLTAENYKIRAEYRTTVGA
jgi:hypothetical protein